VKEVKKGWLADFAKLYMIWVNIPYMNISFTTANHCSGKIVDPDSHAIMGCNSNLRLNFTLE